MTLLLELLEQPVAATPGDRLREAEVDERLRRKTDKVAADDARRRAERERAQVRFSLD